MCEPWCLNLGESDPVELETDGFGEVQTEHCAVGCMRTDRETELLVLVDAGEQLVDTGGEVASPCLQ